MYGAGRSEARALQEQDVFGVGADNSAGQAAIYPARHADRVTILARGDTLAASVSDDPVGGIDATPNTDVRARTGIAGACFAGRG